MNRLHAFWERCITIRARLALAMLLQALLVLPVVAMSIFYFNGVLDTVQEMVTRDTRMARLAVKIAEDIRNVQRSERMYLATGGPPALERVESGLVSIRETLAGLRELDKDGELRYEQIEMRVEDYADVVRLLTERVAEKRELDGPEFDRFAESLAEYGEEVNRLAGEAAAQSWDQVLEKKNRAVLMGERAKRDILTVLMVTLIVSLYFVFVFPHRILSPIRRISNFILQAEVGAPGSVRPIKSRDEVGEMSRLFSRFVRQVQAFDTLKTRQIAHARQQVEALGGLVAEGVLLLKTSLEVEYISSRACELLGCEEAPENLEAVEGAKELVQALRASSGKRTASVEVRPGPEKPHVHCRFRRVQIESGETESIVITLSRAS